MPHDDGQKSEMRVLREENARLHEEEKRLLVMEEELRVARDITLLIIRRAAFPPG